MSVWNQDRLGGYAGKRHMLGLWHPAYKMASAAYMPGTAERCKLRGRIPFSYVLNFDLSANQVANDAFTVTTDFLWTTIAGSFISNTSSPLVPFTVQIFDTKNKRRYMSLPVQNFNFAGEFGFNRLAGNPAFSPLNSALPSNPFNAAWFPFFFRKIVTIPAGAVLLGKVQLANPVGVASGELQICLGGYID